MFSRERFTKGCHVTRNVWACSSSIVTWCWCYDPDSNETPIEPLIPYEVEVKGTQALEDDLTCDSSSGSDSESEESEEAKIEESRPVARVRKINTMIGSVKRGKYYSKYWFLAVFGLKLLVIMFFCCNINQAPCYKKTEKNIFCEEH